MSSSAMEACLSGVHHDLLGHVEGQVASYIPELAKVADKYSLIRSMTHGNNGHETAAYMVQTGWPAGGRVVHPTLGSVVSLLKGHDAGYKGLIPPYVVLTQPQGRFSEAGFLGVMQRVVPNGWLMRGWITNMNGGGRTIHPVSPRNASSSTNTYTSTLASNAGRSLRAFKISSSTTSPMPKPSAGRCTLPPLMSFTRLS